MGIVNAATIRALYISLRGDFTSRFAELIPGSVAELLATVVPSASAQNAYAILGKFPKLREWVGARTVKSLSAAAYTIANKTYEATLGVSVDDIEDDTLGMYPAMARQMAESIVREFNEEIALLMSGGKAALCYDGQNFFDTDHPVYANEDGTGAAATQSNLDVPGANPQTPWYLVDLSGSFKPFIRQERQKPTFQTITDPNQDHVFNLNEILFGIKYRGNYGYGLWQQAYRSEQTLDAAHFTSARVAMRALTTDGGRKLGIKPTHLVVPTSLEATADNLLKKANLAGGESNIDYNRVELVVSDWL